MEQQSALLEGLATTAQLAEEIKVTERTLKRWKAIGYGPRPIKFGGRVYYRRADVKAFIDSLGQPEQPKRRATR